MTTLEKLHWIESHANIYEICYRNAGVGIIFYYGILPPPDDWRSKLSVERYYDSFEEAIGGEYDRISGKVAA
jgi:hypothetical protein